MSQCDFAGVVLLTACLFGAAISQADEQVVSTAPIIVGEALVRLIAEVNVPANEAGTLTDLNVREGDKLTRGQSLGRIEDNLVRMDEKLAQTELEIAEEKSLNDVDERFARKSLEVAQSELTLSQAAAERAPGSISKTELDRLKLVVDKSLLSIEQAERDRRIAVLTKQLKTQSVDRTREQIRRRQITSPIDGLVVEVMAQAGEWVEPGKPILRVIQIEKLRVEVSLDGRSYGSEILGRRVTLSVNVPPNDIEELFEGVVSFVSPEIQPVNGKVRVWAEVNNREQLLRPGVHGKLTIHPNRKISQDDKP